MKDCNVLEEEKEERQSENSASKTRHSKAAKRIQTERNQEELSRREKVVTDTRYNLQQTKRNGEVSGYRDKILNTANVNQETPENDLNHCCLSQYTICH